MGVWKWLFGGSPSPKAAGIAPVPPQSGSSLPKAASNSLTVAPTADLISADPKSSNGNVPPTPVASLRDPPQPPSAPDISEPDKAATPITKLPSDASDEAALGQAVASSVSAHLQVFARNVAANQALDSLATIVTFSIANCISDIIANVIAADRMGQTIEKSYTDKERHVDLLHTAIIAGKNHEFNDYLDSHYEGLVWLKQHKSQKPYAEYVKNYLKHISLSGSLRFVHLVTVVHKTHYLASGPFRVVSHLAIMPVSEAYFQACPMHLWPTSLLSKDEARKLGL